MAAPWYRDGLRFECTGCGKCCTGAPGYVWVNAAEIEALARHLGVSLADFAKRFVRRVVTRYSLRERRGGDCVLFEEGRGCTVHPVRPRQCRTFPFWPENLRSSTAWQELRAECEGLERGRVYPIEEIEIIRRGNGDAAGF